MKTLPDTHVRGIVLPVSSHHLADTAHPVTGPAFPDFLIDIE